MKYLIVVGLLVSGLVAAQEEQSETKKKRPSWSQGLPERQASMKRTNSMYKQEAGSAVTVDDPLLIEKPAAPAFEVDLVTEPIAVPKPVIEIETPAIESQVSVSREQAREQYYSNDQQNASQGESEKNPLFDLYKWKVLKTTPIEVPGEGDGNESLKLNIQINPEGRVTRVSKGNINIPDDVLKSAEKSILNWRFEPPKEIGITENISKVFTIDIRT